MTKIIKFLKNNIWKISLVVILCSLIFVIPLYLNVNNYETNHKPVSDDKLVLKDEYTQKRTSVKIQKQESIDYDIYVYGENISKITIFLVTFSVYFQYNPTNFSSLNDYWDYLYLGVNYSNCIMIKGESYSRHSVNYNVKLSPIEEYVFLFFNFGEENVNISIEYKINNIYIQNRQKFLDIIITSFGITTPIIAVILAVNQLIELREKTSKISIESESEPLKVKIEREN